MIDEFFNGNLGGELGHSAKVVAVPMRGNQMIDLLKSGVLDRIDDAACIARSRDCSDIPGIDEQGLAGRRNKQYRVAALHVDDVDLQGSPRLRHGNGGRAQSYRKKYC